LADRLQNKQKIQDQIEMNKQLEAEAKSEYLREKEQVDSIILRMIAEDREMARIQSLKQQQA
jgi:hypothetical protein